MRSLRAARSAARALTHPPLSSSSSTAVAVSSSSSSLLRVLPSAQLQSQRQQQQQQQQQQQYLRCCYRRSFSTSPVSASGSASAAGAKPENNTTTTTTNGLSDNEYHDIADDYLDKLVAALEAKAEADETLEVEYSAGVLSIAHKNGTYVINKQPPNKQIWLSSPVSGPKRYDWVASGVSGQDEKEGTEFATGDDGRGGWWVYARDGSRLSTLLKREVGVEVNQEDE